MLNNKIALIFAALLVGTMARPNNFGNFGNLGGFVNPASGSATALGMGQNFPGGGQLAVGFSQSNAQNGGSASGVGTGFAQESFFGESAGGSAQTFSQGK